MFPGKSGSGTLCKVTWDSLFAYTKIDDIHEWMVDMDAISICGGNTLCGEVRIHHNQPENNQEYNHKQQGIIKEILIFNFFLFSGCHEPLLLIHI